MKNIRDKAIEVLAGMRQGMLERDEVLALTLLSAMAGESIFLLGLPGVGKSMVARRLKTAFEGASVFEYLMSRFSTPDEIFGPVSISKLKDEDRYERMTEGFLPEAEIVFLDEIWKAGPAIQNSLLTVLNEKVYLNGNLEIHLPLKGIVAASNELPAKDEGLEALWDRFLIRFVVEPIVEADNFKRLLLSDKDNEFRRVFTPFSRKEYEDVQRGSALIEIPQDALECIITLHDKMQAKANATERETGEPVENRARYYISDRRWKKCMRILRTSAFLNGRNSVDFSDVLLLSHMIWNDDTMISEVRAMTVEAVVSAVFKKILDGAKSPKRHASSKSGKETEFSSPNGSHYLIDCEGSPLKIRKTDYDRLREDPRGIYFGSETTDGTLIFSDGGQFAISFEKKGVLKINGYSYRLVTDADKELGKEFISETEDVFESAMGRLLHEIERNIFTNGTQIVRTVQGVTALYRKRFMQLRGK